MADARVPVASLLACIALAALAPAAHAADSVTVYRCTDARGKVVLRDKPCPGGQKQSTKEMLQFPTPPRPARLNPVSVSAPTAPQPQYIVVNTPRPLYECVAPDGKTYTSESAEGNPRWMPLWALHYPVLEERTLYRPGSSSLRYRDGRVDARVRSGGVERRVVPTIAAYGAGTWVRDACYALPQQDVCARLRDRRDEVRRLHFNGQPSERAVLDVEERSINARLASDCGRY